MAATTHDGFPAHARPAAHEAPLLSQSAAGVFAGFGLVAALSMGWMLARPAGTYNYHTHHNSASQKPLGLYGVFIVDPKPGTALAQRDASYDREYLQVIGEFKGYYVINGKAFPSTEQIAAEVGEKVRIRLVNIGEGAHPMHLHGFHFKVVGMDGIAVEGPPMVKDTINIAPGERYDLELVADEPGTWVFHCHILSHVANMGVDPGGMITVVKVT